MDRKDIDPKDLETFMEALEVPLSLIAMRLYVIGEAAKLANTEPARAQARINAEVKNGRRALRHALSVMDYNLRRMEFKRQGADRMFPDFERQKTLALEVE